MTTVDQPRQHRGRALGRAARACAVALAIGLLVVAVCFIVVATGSASATQDFSFAFAIYILPAIVVLSLGLFLATLVLGIVSLVQADGADRRPAIVALIVGILVIALYVTWAIVLGSLLSPHVTA
jgi:hypothetical protein